MKQQYSDDEMADIFRDGINESKDDLIREMIKPINQLEVQMPKVWVIWLSNEDQSSILGAASTLDKAMEKVSNFGDLSPRQRKTQYDGTIEVKIDGYNYLFFVPA